MRIRGPAHRGDPSPAGLRRRRRRRDEVVAWLALAMLLVVFRTAPDDGWGHAQPRTMAYAVDIANGGSWALPRDEDGLPATKPPLHPWLAAPAVAAAGPHRWIAHRWPDIAAAAAVMGLLIAAGRRWWPRSGGQVGAVAATMWITSLTGAKTAVLARPDMLLTAAVTIGWIAFASMVLADAGRRGRASLDEGHPREPGPARRCRRPWLIAGAAAMGGLAKGPAILPLVPALWLAGRWTGAAGRTGWRRLVAPGIIAAGLLPPAAWLAAATVADPAWVSDGLIRGEVLDRVSGTMDEPGTHGPLGLLRTAGYMPTYLGIRFLPWTVPLVLAAILAFRPGLAVRFIGRRPADRIVPRIALAVVLATLAVFTFSAGKRADYLAPCLPAASMAAAWWLVRGDRRLHVRAPWAVPLAAAVLLMVQVVHQRRPNHGLPAELGSAIAEVAERTHRLARAESLPVMTLGSGGTSLPLRLGLVPADPPGRFGELVAHGRPFLMVHATLGPAPIDGAAWAAGHPGVRTAVAIVARRGQRILPMDGAGAAGPGERGGATDPGSWGVWLVRVDPWPAGEATAGR